MNMPKVSRVAAPTSEAYRQLVLADTFFMHSVSCMVILDRDYNFIRVNEAYAKACRRNISEFAGRNHFELYPSDAKLIFDEVLHSKLPFVTFTRAFEFADQPERGVTYWDWTLVPVLDEREEIEFLVFSLVEVTDRKRAEEALRIAALVYQHSSEAMMVTDAQARILAVNEAFTQLTGYTTHEVMGNTPAMFKSGRQSPEFYRLMWRELQTVGRWQGEVWDKTKSGEALAIRLTINTVYDTQGKVDRRVALFSDITEQKQTQALIWSQANFDVLTRLPNRQLFHERLMAQIDRARSVGDSLAVLLIDLDQFKEVNDNLGHDKGDALLIEVARRITQELGESVSCARVGGDEFAVTLSGSQVAAAAELLAQRLVAVLALPVRLGVERVFVSASIGIALFPNNSRSAEDLLRHADQALYAAKDKGRNGYCFFTGALEETAQARMRLGNALRDALAGEQFEVHYQPIVEMGSGRIRKAEALLRWRHPTRGMVGPDEFIPLAESSGLIVDIGDWVFRQAAALTRRLRARFGEFQISVNVSPVQFRNGHSLSGCWLGHLAEQELPAQSLVVEITEGLLLDLGAEVRGELLALRDAGLQTALDDFGTGYSSLAYLKKLNIDYLKIDRMFVRNLETEADDRVLCDAMIAMAHKLGLKVIAEGVETAAQRDLLYVAGCDYGQGYLFSRPLSEAAFLDYLG